ncbi:MAG: hypothetical protein M1834_000921 [Cirrosporium novae-zelandiae]|nr:MAG: hypothetical protein M1834_000921 [Cirrosporium novae-zelandiae]
MHYLSYMLFVAAAEAGLIVDGDASINAQISGVPTNVEFSVNIDLNTKQSKAYSTTAGGSGILSSWFTGSILDQSLFTTTSSTQGAISSLPIYKSIFSNNQSSLVAMSNSIQSSGTATTKDQIVSSGRGYYSTYSLVPTSIPPGVFFTGLPAQTGGTSASLDLIISSLLNANSSSKITYSKPTLRFTPVATTSPLASTPANSGAAWLLASKGSYTLVILAICFFSWTLF